MVAVLPSPWSSSLPRNCNGLCDRSWGSDVFPSLVTGQVRVNDTFRQDSNLQAFRTAVFQATCIHFTTALSFTLFCSLPGKENKEPDNEQKRVNDCVNSFTPLVLSCVFPHMAIQASELCLELSLHHPVCGLLHLPNHLGVTSIAHWENRLAW